MRVIHSLALLGCADAVGDLQRARTKVPRDEYRASHGYAMGKVLNKHLQNAHGNTKPCHEWSVQELQELQSALLQHRDESLDGIYREASDTRAMLREEAEYPSHWAEITEAAKSHPNIIKMQRDGHCQEAVMWWTHHVPEAAKSNLQHLTLPTLPVVAWREPSAEEGDDAMKVYRAHYHPSSTCLACHSGGLPWQDPDVQPAPIPRQINNHDRIRRCDEWYGEEEGGACGACDGRAGTYYGDLPDESLFYDCEVVALPEDVPLEERSTGTFPKKFAVDMRGADRWPRASPSGNATCNFTTDCSPYDASKEGQPIPPGVVDAHWYAPIHGVLHVDHADGLYGGGLLRHETVYQLPSGKEGADRHELGINGDRNVHLSEIHIQTAEMSTSDPVDPGVMLNLVHQNMTSMNESGIDDTTLDWRRIPANPQLAHDGCVCVPDPAGLPWFHHAFDNATYLGRVRFVPPFGQKTFVGGPSDGTPIVADHFAKWSFHLWIDIETQLPAMFTSPYGGVASYGNWTLDPDEYWPESVGGGWKDMPSKDNCFDVTHADTCAPYTRPHVSFV